MTTDLAAALGSPRAFDDDEQVRHLPGDHVPWLVVQTPGRAEFATPVAQGDAPSWHRLIDHDRFPGGVWREFLVPRDGGAGPQRFEGAALSARAVDLAGFAAAAWSSDDAIVIEPPARPDGFTVVRIGDYLIGVVGDLVHPRPDAPEVRAEWSALLRSRDDTGTTR
ncbi:hypothetical protein [Nocardia transvalensis]|uniref:hypothetical protein n=1 Tax=Nocardia transvalensis TaxID=37333 RepID=UPI001893EE26|nr:hypothetical protein [Nocardia transvalensis]MBF6333648.1 hypothetical protein [Nocardia transvalensis]